MGRAYRVAALALVVIGLTGIRPVMAASDVRNLPSQSNRAASNLAATVAAQQTTAIISAAASGGFLATVGGQGGKAELAPARDQLQTFSSRTTGVASGSSGAVYGVWAQGMWSDINKTESGLEMKGDVYDAMTGFDARLNNRFLLGLAVGYENINLTTKYNSGSFRGTGYSFIPYVGINLNRHWLADLALDYTSLKYNTTSNSSLKNGTYTGSFDASRWVASSNLIGNYSEGNWRFQPRAIATFIREEQSAYVQSDGTHIGPNTATLGQLSGGGKVGYVFDGEDLGLSDTHLTITPFGKLLAQWNYKEGGQVMKTNHLMSEQERGGLVAGLGVEGAAEGFAASLEVDNGSLLRSDLTVLSVIARLRYGF